MKRVVLDTNIIISSALGGALVFVLVKLIEKNRQDGFGEIIAGKIRSWQDEANERVQNKQLSQSLPSTVQSVLKNLRKSQGSETVFVCGHLNLEERIPYLVLFWMGDVRFRLFDRYGSEVDAGAKWISTERWSTKYGLMGRNIPHVWVGNLREHEIARVMAYSDGLSTVDNEIPMFSSAELQHKANELLLSSSSDDISFIDILLFPFDKIVQEKFQQLPRKYKRNDPLRMGIEFLSESECVLSWEKVHKVEQYILMEASPVLPWREIYRSTKPDLFTIKDRLPGKYMYKLKVLYPSADEEEGSEIVLEFKDKEKK